MTAPPLLDRAVIDDLVATIGADGTRSVIELFIAESAGYRAAITAGAAPAANRARRDAARRAAHALKSGAGQIGAAALSAAAAAVEQAVAEGRQDLAGLAVALEERLAATIGALNGLPTR